MTFCIGSADIDKIEARLTDKEETAVIDIETVGGSEGQIFLSGGHARALLASLQTAITHMREP